MTARDAIAAIATILGRYVLRAADERSLQLQVQTVEHAEFVARVKACTRLLERGAGHVVVAFALLCGELPRGAAR